MTQRVYLHIVGVFFLVVGLLHLARVFFRWQASIGGWEVPLWLSAVAIFVSGYFAYTSFSLLKKKE